MACAILRQSIDALRPASPLSSGPAKCEASSQPSASTNNGENFDVSVDGQKLATLSGSGKACANLALRIGLGQVLTNNVFSVFVGDEIDASMDEDRSEFTQNSLKSLSDKISQVIIITHKPPTADHVIEL